MKLSKIIEKCKLEKVVYEGDCEIKAGYCGDLMSDVMAHAEPDSIWITIQAHKNSIAVALIKDIKAIVFTNDITIEGDVIKKAREENINLLRTKENSFNICGEIYCMMEGKTDTD